MNDTFNPTSSPTGSPITYAPTRPPGADISDFVDSTGCKIIALTCTLVVLVIAGYNIFKHLVHFSEPKLQKNIVRILFMVPFYSVFSLLALIIPTAEPYLDPVRDCYEAFVVYCFLNLMLSYCGGENACVSCIMQEPGSITHVWPVGCCFPEIALNSRFLRRCKQLTLQFVIMKPIMAILSLLFLILGMSEDKGWVVTQLVVYNISYTLALYALVLFYKATRSHPGLKGQRPILKFMSVKLVVFATYYQGLLVDLLPMPSDSLLSLNNFILCCEMVLFAILQYWAFSWKEFRSSGSNSAHVQSGSEFDSEAFDSTTNDIALSNAKDIINMHDVAKDAYYNFNNKYGDHVLLDAGKSDEMEDSPKNHLSKSNSSHMDIEMNPFESAATGFGGTTTSSSPDPNFSIAQEAFLTDNPFDQDVADPFKLKSPSDSVVDIQDEWVPDFEQDTSANTKKKKKKSKAKATNDNLAMI